MHMEPSPHPNVALLGSMWLKRGDIMQTVRKSWISNALLMLGLTTLTGFGVLELTGFSAEPILPASAALLIGCTAVLDRLGIESQN